MIEELRNIIVDSLVSPDDSGRKITLQEPDNSEWIPIELNKGNTKTLTIKPKSGRDTHPMLRNLKKLKKIPDYIIFCENKKLIPNKTIALIVELKEKNKDDWHRQAKAGVTISEYLVGMLEGYKKTKYCNFECRCLLYRATGKNKGTKASGVRFDEHPDFGYKFLCGRKNFTDIELFLQ